MKVVIAALRDLDHFVSREFAYIIRELVAVHGWKHLEFRRLWADPRPLRDQLLAACGAPPEVVLFWEGYDLICRHADEIQGLDCLKAVFADDLHRIDTDRRRWTQSLAYLICDVVFATYGYALDRHFPEVRPFGRARVVWVPHSASPDFLVPFHAEAENAIFLSGSMIRVYPLRRQMKALHDQGRYRIVHQPHPPYHVSYDYARDPRVGPGYARTINGHRAAFTDGSQWHLTVAKFFEIPATGALLLADAAVAEPLRQLGFVAGEHYVPASADDLEEQVRYVLDEANHPQLDAVRQRAQALVWARHKTSDRARLIDEVCRAGR